MSGQASFGLVAWFSLGGEYFLCFQGVALGVDDVLVESLENQTSCFTVFASTQCLLSSIPFVINFSSFIKINK